MRVYARHDKTASKYISIKYYELSPKVHMGEREIYVHLALKANRTYYAFYSSIYRRARAATTTTTNVILQQDSIKSTPPFLLRKKRHKA